MRYTAPCLSQLLSTGCPRTAGRRRVAKVAKRGSAQDTDSQAVVDDGHADQRLGTKSLQDTALLPDDGFGASFRLQDAQASAHRILLDMAYLEPIKTPGCIGTLRASTARAGRRMGSKASARRRASTSDVPHFAATADASDDVTVDLACEGETTSQQHRGLPSDCGTMLDGGCEAMAQDGTQILLHSPCETGVMADSTDASHRCSRQVVPGVCSRQVVPGACGKQPTLWKVRLCAKFMHGECTAGSDCPFAHGTKELLASPAADADLEQELVHRLGGFVLPAIPQYISTQDMVQRNQKRQDHQELVQQGLDRSPATSLELRASAAPASLSRDWQQMHMFTPRDFLFSALSLPPFEQQATRRRPSTTSTSTAVSRPDVAELLSIGTEAPDGNFGFVDAFPRLSSSFPLRIPFSVSPRRPMTVTSISDAYLRSNAVKLEPVQRIEGRIVPTSEKDEWVQDNGRHRIKVETIVANPHDVLFANPYILDRFSCGRSVESTIADLVRGQISCEDIPKIRVVWRHGKLVTLDHRRLYAFRAALPSDAQIRMKLVLSDVLSDQFSTGRTKNTVGVQKFCSPRAATCQGEHVIH